jgi:tetratricopeptide (TPR) repeat protein
MSDPPRPRAVILDFPRDRLRRDLFAAAPGPGAEADAYYRLGCEIEPRSPERAREAYGRAIALDPAHADASVNLGRLVHEAGDPTAAEAHYRAALAARPADATAAFNLAVALEDQGRHEEAAGAYRRAVAADPLCADAHYNLACLEERLGDRAAAIRHLLAFRRIVGAKVLRREGA